MQRAEPTNWRLLTRVLCQRGVGGVSYCVPMLYCRMLGRADVPRVLRRYLLAGLSAKTAPRPVPHSPAEMNILGMGSCDSDYEASRW